MEAPTIAEQEALVRSFRSPYPLGFRAWAERLRVRQERGGFGPWQHMNWHDEFDAKLRACLGRRNRWLYFLKPRKRGASLKCTAMALYETMYTPFSSKIYVTWHEDAAYGKEDSIQDRMQVMYRGLPEWERALSPPVKCPEGEFGVQGELVVAQRWHSGAPTEGRLKISTASPNVGAHADYDMAFLDEVDRWPQVENSVSSIEGSVARSGGPVVAWSTLTVDSHPGRWLWRKFEQARRGEIDAEWLYVGFGSRTDDDWAMWEQKRQDAEVSASLVQFYRDYNRTVEEALLGTGTGLSDMESLRACYGAMRPLPLPQGLEELAGI